MSKIFVRVHQLKGTDCGSLVAWTRAAPAGVATSCKFAGKPLSCYKLWQLEVPEISPKISVEIILKKSGVFSEYEVSSLELPIDWFQENSTTRMWFPMKGIHRKFMEVMIEVEIHVCTNNSRPFDAPAHKLLVEPAWEIPGPAHIPPPKNVTVQPRQTGDAYQPILNNVNVSPPVMPVTIPYPSYPVPDVPPGYVAPQPYNSPPPEHYYQPATGSISPYDDGYVNPDRN